MSDAHSCLTKASFLAVLRRPSLYPRTFLRIWDALTTYRQCQQAIDDLREVGPRPRKHLLAPLTHWLARLRAISEWPEFLTKSDPIKPLGLVKYRPTSSGDPS